MRMTPLAFLRRLRGWSQTELAIRAGFGLTSIKRWEAVSAHLLRRLSLETIDRLASVLGATRGQVVGEEAIDGFNSTLAAQADTSRDEIIEQLWSAVEDSGSQIVMVDGEPQLILGTGKRSDSAEFWFRKAPTPEIVASLRQREQRPQGRIIRKEQTA